MVVPSNRYTRSVDRPKGAAAVASSLGDVAAIEILVV
jgi:hypothetical protein